MKKNLLFPVFCIILLCMGCMQHPQPKTFRNTGNPLIKDKFTADPAPLVHDGTLYLYEDTMSITKVRTPLTAAKSLTSPSGSATPRKTCRHGPTTVPC